MFGFSVGYGRGQVPTIHTRFVYTQIDDYSLTFVGCTLTKEYTMVVFFSNTDLMYKVCTPSNIWTSMYNMDVECFEKEKLYYTETFQKKK